MGYQYFPGFFIIIKCGNNSNHLMCTRFANLYISLTWDHHTVYGPWGAYAYFMFIWSNVVDWGDECPNYAALHTAVPSPRHTLQWHHRTTQCSDITAQHTAVTSPHHTLQWHHRTTHCSDITAQHTAAISPHHTLQWHHCITFTKTSPCNYK